MSRRPGARFNRGRIQTVAGSYTPPSPVVPAFFAYGTLTDGQETNQAVAGDDINAIVYATPLTTDPATGDRYRLWYRSSDSRAIVSKQTAGVGSWVDTVSTSTIFGMTDDHCVLAAHVDSTSRLVVAFGFHSDQMRVWRAPSPGDTLITDATMLCTPVTPGSEMATGNAAVESLATYPMWAAYTNGELLYTFRTGGSGNGDQVGYSLIGTTVAIIDNDIISGQGTRSAYMDHPFIEGSTSAVPNRLWFAWQWRDSVSPTDAYDVYCAYSDSRGAPGSWRAVDGTVLTSPITSTNAAAAKVATVAIGTVNYNATQAFTVGLDGVPTIMRFYGTVGVDYNLRGWRYSGTGTTWNARQITNWNQSTLVGGSRPFMVWKDGTAVCFYSKTTTDDNIGHLTYSTAVGSTLATPAEGRFTYLNGVNDIKNASPIHDSRLWQSSGQTVLSMFNMKAGINQTVSSNRPAVLTTTLDLAAPPAFATPLVASGGMPLWLDTAFSTAIPWLDQSTNGRDAVQVTGTRQPSVVAATGGVTAGFSAFRGDGTDDALGAPYTRPAPGTTPTYYFAIVKFNGWTASDQIINDGGMGCFQNTSSPQTRVTNGTNGPLNAGGVITGAFKYIEIQLTNSTADYYRCGRIFVNGTNVGNTAGTGTVSILAATTAGVGATSADIMVLGIISGTASFDLRGKIMAYYAARLGEAIFE